MVKILVICPYEEYMLKAIIQTQVIDIAKFIIIGSRKRIIEKCYLKDINYQLLNIIDIDNELEICFKANEILNQDDVLGVIFGNFPASFQKNIIKLDNDISIIDVPKAAHLLIVPRYVNDEFISFDEKKQAILTCKELLAKYNIEYFKIGFVTGKKTCTLDIEKSIIKLDKELSNYKIDIITIDQIFSDKYNVLIFNNTDAANIFIETVLMLEKSKYANIKKASKHYVIDACEMQYRNLFFSIFMVSKLRLNAEAC